MKYKKISYLLVLMLMLIVGINRTYAEESKDCYYMSSGQEFKSSLKITWGYKNPGWHGLNDFTKVSVDKIGENNFTFDNESVLNWWSNLRTKCVKDSSVCFDDYYNNSKQANENSNPSCPKYLVFQHCTMYAVWATDSETIAQNAVKGSQSKNCTGYYATSVNEYGQQISSEEYYSEFVAKGIVEYDIHSEPTCADYDEIFGSKDDPKSFRYMVNTILDYVRVIVPILIILLGTLDFAKAVIAGKEDNMKKAQNDFIKRVIMGVAVFFAPVIVDIIMELAEIVWNGEYMHCDL